MSALQRQHLGRHADDTVGRAHRLSSSYLPQLPGNTLPLAFLSHCFALSRPWLNTWKHHNRNPICIRSPIILVSASVHTDTKFDSDGFLPSHSIVTLHPTVYAAMIRRRQIIVNHPLHLASAVVCNTARFTNLVVQLTWTKLEPPDDLSNQTRLRVYVYSMYISATNYKHGCSKHV